MLLALSPSPAIASLSCTMVSLTRSMEATDPSTSRSPVAALALEFWALSESPRTCTEASLAVAATRFMACAVSARWSRCTSTPLFTAVIRCERPRTSSESLLQTVWALCSTLPPCSVFCRKASFSASSAVSRLCRSAFSSCSRTSAASFSGWRAAAARSCSRQCRARCAASPCRALSPTSISVPV